MAFNDDLQTGKAYEDEVIDIFNLLFDREFRKVAKETDPSLYKFLDIIEVNKTKKKKYLTELITIECKYSGDRHNNSPNVVVEYLTYDNKPSGICTSIAMYWVFRTGKFHLIVKRDELLKAIIFDLGHTPSHRQITIKQYDKKTLLLVPISLLIDAHLCPSTQRQLTRQAMENGGSKKENGDTN